MTASSLAEMAQKVASGAAISEEDARLLMGVHDLVSVGMIATEARRARLGDRVSFVRVAEIDVAAAAAAPAALGDAPAAAWPPPAAREIRITGTPASLDAAIASVRALTLRLGTAAPARGAGSTSAEGASASAANARADADAASAASARTASADAGRLITAFALDELWALADRDAARLGEFARALRDAGVAAIAEVPLDGFAEGEAAKALEAVLSAGLLAPVATWREAPADAVAALKELHALQERAHAFRAFAPLPRQGSVTTPSTGYEDVKIVAIARALLNNIDHIQVDWAAHGPKLAQVALLFGASDLDRVAPSDDAPLGPRRAPLEDVQRNIKAAFLEPVERDARFDRVAR